MEVVKFFLNGKKKGVYCITDKDEVTNVLLDELNKGNTNTDWTKSTLELHLKQGLVVPKYETAFDWDENIHGKFFN